MHIESKNEIRYTDDTQTHQGLKFEFFETPQGLRMAKEILYSKVDSKIELFEKCLDEVGLYKTFPFMDLKYKLNFGLFKNKEVHSKSGMIFPIDKTEEILMRNCVRRNLMALKRSKDIINENIN